MMILSAAASFAFLTLVPPIVQADNRSHGDGCTHGKLYVTDDATSLTHIFDVSQGNLQFLSVESTIALPSEGAGGLVFYGPPGDPLVVQYRGTEENHFDGFVRVINTGFHVGEHGVHYDPPSIAQNAIIDDCRSPVHQVRHDDKIAIFCDGAYDHDPQLNATVYVIDETKLASTTETAIVQQVTLQAAHHGVAIPVDDGHLLHSLATDDRINRVPDETSLPETFQVIDLQGSILHELSNTTDPNAHCSGFHGSATYVNTFLLACDDVHGGIVRVKYDPTNKGYTSRAILYPDDETYNGFRVGSFAYHKKNPYSVGSYALSGGSEFHLFAIGPEATALEESNIVTLPARQCAYQFEVGTGKHLLVFMPNGVLHVFEIENGGFVEIMSQQIVPRMTACSEAAFVGGIGQAFVAVPASRTMYALDLHGVEEGRINVYESALPFTPIAMTVSGFDEENACELQNHSEPTPSGVYALSLIGVLSMMVAVFLF